MEELPQEDCEGSRLGGGGEYYSVESPTLATRVEEAICVLLALYVIDGEFGE